MASPSEEKIALIMSGTNGIGKAVAARLIELKAAKVVLVGRDAEKTERVAKEIGAPETLVVDVTSQAEIRRFAATLAERYTHIDYLVMTACVYGPTRQETVDGVENHLASLYLWRFQLIGLIKDLLRGGRVVNVSAAGMKYEVYFDDPNCEKEWSVTKSNTQAQYLNDVFTLEAQRRWGETQFHVVFPGMVNVGERNPLTGIAAFLYNNLLTPFKKSPEASARQLVPLLLEDVGAKGGKLWSAGFGTGPVRELTPDSRVADPEFGQKCWQ